MPVVLTDLYAGALLPGLFGARVYAGHWSLTPHFDEKSNVLKRAGLEASVEAVYDRSSLADLVRDTKADYILLKRTTPAAESIGKCTHSEPAFTGQRWIAVNTSGWSCP